MYYLNNTGHRWETDDMSFYLRYKDGTLVPRKADCMEAFGNFAVIVFRHKGKTIKSFPNDFDKHEGRMIVDVCPEWE